jgi:CRP-like cAMP-binding protein
LTVDVHTSVLGLLKEGAWFGGLPPALQKLILQESVVRTYRKGQVIVREGEPPKGMFVVLEGRVRAIRDVGDGDEVLLHVGEAGCWFAYYSLFHRRPSIGSVVADSRVRALLLTAPKFERIIEDEPRYYRAFADLALEHYAVLFRYVAEGHGLAPEDLLRARLADMAGLRRYERPTDGPVSVNVSQSDLATMLGVSRQTLNGLLARLQADGLIEVGFRRIRVLDEARLRNERGSEDTADSSRRAAAAGAHDGAPRLGGVA